MPLNHAFQHGLSNLPVAGRTDKVSSRDPGSWIGVRDVHPDDVLRNTVKFNLGDHIMGVLKLFAVWQFQVIKLFATNRFFLGLGTQRMPDIHFVAPFLGKSVGTIFKERVL